MEIKMLARGGGGKGRSSGEGRALNIRGKKIWKIGDDEGAEPPVI